MTDISWGFHAYVSPAGGKLVQDWYDDLPDTAAEEFSDVYAYLRVAPFEVWKRPKVAPISDGVSEIRIKDKVEKIQHRIYGFFWPEGTRFQYTLLHGTSKKKDNDKNGKAEAAKRKKQVEQGTADIHEFYFEKSFD